MFARLNQAVLVRMAEYRAQDQGQTMAEYGLLLALIAIAVVVAATALGGAISGQYDAVVAKL